jgi:ATP-dependent Clp protease ATP-binding subunit ClpA
MQLEKRLNNIIISAFYEARQEKHEYITPEHVFYSTLFNEDTVEMLEELGADIEYMKSEMKNFLNENIPKVETAEVIQSEGFQKLLNIAATKAASSNRDTVELADILVTIYDTPESFASFIMKNEGIERYDLLSVISHGSYEEELTFDEGDEVGKESSHKNRADSPSKYLEAFTVDLTKKAENGELDPVIGREDVLERTIQVLLRRNKNNPIHVGEPGVGKTAITHGLAQMIVNGDVPEKLLDHTILRLDMGLLLAGTKYRGDFEDRMKKILKAFEKIDKLIVFIDEIHSLVGAGSAGSSNIDASSMLKPLLTEGNIKCIGATTYDEYRKHFEKDAALNRRFQKIDVPEPDIPDAVEMLKGIISKYEDFHGVRYIPESLEAAAELSSRYINDRYLPDKAIDLIDETGAANSMAKKRSTIITPSHIEKTISLNTGKKGEKVRVNRFKMLKNLNKSISAKIFGQKQAVDAVVNAVKKSYAGFRPLQKPVASFLFAGPTGVGKTELAKVLATELGMPLHRFDMSEYQEKHSVAKLIGAPPGYVGYDDGGLLTESIRRQPCSVLLLDEIEKAHSDIFNSLLQIMDYAVLTDNTGRKADFKNVIIIMTSNAGARFLGKSRTGFGDRSYDSPVLKEAVEKTFSPEFRNRLDTVVYFSSLTPAVVEDVVRKNIDELSERLLAKKVNLSVTPGVIKHLAAKSYSREFGARETARIVEEALESLLLEEILFGSFRNGGKVAVGISKGTLILKNPEN